MSKNYEVIVILICLRYDNFLQVFQYDAIESTKLIGFRWGSSYTVTLLSSSDSVNSIKTFAITVEQANQKW